MRKKALFSLVGALIAAIALVSASGAATTKAQKVTRINVSTRAAVVHYLHSIHVKAKGAVIQRGFRNYAGARCPGKRWTCVSTKHTVVQITGHGGKNRFACRSKHCVVVQISGVSRGVYVSGRQLAAKGGGGGGGSTGSCIKTTGLTQSCSINQSGVGPNTAFVYENAGKSSGLTQSAAYTAVVTQTATGGLASQGNTACVTQNINLDGSTTAQRGKPVVVTLEAHQSVIVKQDASGLGPNAAVNGAKLVNGVASCDTSATLGQNQTLTSVANGSASITQNANDQQILCGDGVTGPPGTGDYANLCLDIEQNQSTGFNNNTNVKGANTANFNQTDLLGQIANTQNGPVLQTEGNSDPNVGGIIGTINQWSKGLSSANPEQHEKECEDAATGGLMPGTPGPTTDWCSITGDPGKPSYPLTQNAYGPAGIGTLGRMGRSSSHLHFNVVKKGLGQATQFGNAADNYNVNQTSTQITDAGSNVTNHVAGDCQTDGNCTAGQTTTINGTPTQDGWSAQSIPSITIDCNTSSTCNATAPPVPVIDATSEPPAQTESRSVTPTWTDAATLGSVTFKCSLSGTGGFTLTPCTSGTTYSGLGTGPHTFQVEAVDKTASHNASDPTQAQFSWTVVDARISISPSDTNEVGTSQTFTVTVLKDIGDGNGMTTPASGEHVNFTLTDANGAAHTAATGTCTGAGANTDSNGQCAITFTSPSAGQVTGHASVSLTIGTATLSRATGDGKSGDSTDAVQTFVDAKISISPLTATDEVGSSHTFTVTLMKNAGGGSFAAASGEHVTVTLTDNNGAANTGSTGSCTNSGANTDALGQCTITFNSASAGTVTVNAASTLSVGGVSLTRATGDGKSGDSTDAVQTFVDAKISITPSSVNNSLSQSQTFTVTVTASPAGTGTPVFADPVIAETPTPDLASSTACDPNSIQVNGNVMTCSVTVNSDQAATADVQASDQVTMGGVQVTRTTGDGKSGDSPDAAITWS